MRIEQHRPHDADCRHRTHIGQVKYGSQKLVQFCIAQHKHEQQQRHDHLEGHLKQCEIKCMKRSICHTLILKHFDVVGNSGERDIFHININIHQTDPDRSRQRYKYKYGKYEQGRRDKRIRLHLMLHTVLSLFYFHNFHPLRLAAIFASVTVRHQSEITASSASEASCTLCVTSAPDKIFSIIGFMTSLSIMLPHSSPRCQSRPISDALDTALKISLF